MQSHLTFRRVNNSQRQQGNDIELNRVWWATGSLQVRFVAVCALQKWHLDGMSVVGSVGIIHQSGANLGQSCLGRPVLKYISREVNFIQVQHPPRRTTLWLPKLLNENWSLELRFVDQVQNNIHKSCCMDLLEWQYC
jgi:hypothetical protein